MRKIYSVPIFSTSLPGGHCEREPPDPIPNSEVKLLSADDSVGLPHVKVGHRQVLIPKAPYSKEYGAFSFMARWCLLLLQRAHVTISLGPICLAQIGSIEGCSDGEHQDDANQRNRTAFGCEGPGI